jgi:hypothetical protein
MSRRDLLKEIYKKNISEEQGEDMISATLRSHQAAKIQDILGLNNIEWTAHAQGASLSEIASWRYQGWPKFCAICGASICVKDFGWFVTDVNGVRKLKHIVCPIGSEKGRDGSL